MIERNYILKKAILFYLCLLVFIWWLSGDNFFFLTFCSYFSSSSSSSPHVASTKRFTINASIFDQRFVGNVRGMFRIIFTFLLLFSLHSN